MAFYHSIQKSIQDILWGFIIKTVVMIVNFVTDKGMICCEEGIYYGYIIDYVTGSYCS